MHAPKADYASIPSLTLRIEHGGLGVKRDALFKYILANMNCNYDISMESQLTNLFIDVFVFKVTKLSAV